MDLMWSILPMLRPWMSYDYTIIQVVCWIELPEQIRLCQKIFENMGPDKWDTIIMWYRVTRNPQEFRGLTGCQRDECLKHSYYTRVHFMFLVDFTFK